MTTENFKVLFKEAIAEDPTIAVLKTDVAVLKTDVAVLKTDVAVLKTDVAVLKTDVSVLKTDVAVLKTDVIELRGETRRLGVLMEDMGGKVDLILEMIKHLYDENRRWLELQKRADACEEDRSVTRAALRSHLDDAYLHPPRPSR